MSAIQPRSFSSGHGARRSARLRPIYAILGHRVATPLLKPPPLVHCRPVDPNAIRQSYTTNPIYQCPYQPCPHPMLPLPRGSFVPRGSHRILHRNIPPCSSPRQLAPTAASIRQPFVIPGDKRGKETHNACSGITGRSGSSADGSTRCVTSTAGPFFPHLQHGIRCGQYEGGEEDTRGGRTAGRDARAASM